MTRHQLRRPGPVRPAGGDVTPHVLSGDMTMTVTPTGPQIVSTYFVDNVTGPALLRPITAGRAPGIPEFGSSHPFWPSVPVSNIAIRRIDDSPSKFMVTVTWGFMPTGGDDFQNLPSDTELPQLEVLSSVQPATTVYAYLESGARVPMLVKRNIGVREVEEGEPTPEPVWDVQTVSVEYQAPGNTFIYRRREAESPATKARQFVGRVNSVGVFGDPPHFWLCTQLDGVSDDSGKTYNVTYAFQRGIQRLGWNVDVFWRDPKTGEIPVDFVDGEDHRVFSPYPEADFWDLNLTV